MAVIPANGRGLFQFSGKRMRYLLPGRESKPAPVPLRFDPNADLSITNGNPNGVWSYGIMDAGFGNFTLLSFTYNTSPFMGWGIPVPWVIVFRNTTASPVAGIPAGGLALHPMPDATPGVLRWTAPKGFARLSLVGQFLPGDVSVTSVAIRRRGVVLFSAVDSGSFNLALSNVTVGETIDFCAYGSTTSSSTPLSLAISGVPTS